MPDSTFSIIGKAVSFVAQKGVYNTACAIMTDKETVELAKWAKLSDKPLAASMLDHYLQGSGKDVAVDTTKMFNEDPVLARYFIGQVKDPVRAGTASGNVPISQDRYGNQDWRMALGSINLQWKVVERNTVETWFVNKYRWHPGVNRVTQCVHEAADNLKASGAAEFMMVGSRHRLVV